MSGAITTRFAMARPNLTSRMLLGAYCTVCCGMLIASHSGVAGARAGILCTLLLGAAILAFTGYMVISDQAQAGKLFELHRLPLILWKKWLKGTIGELSISFVAAGGFSVALLMSPASNFGGTGGIALLSIALSTGVLIGLGISAALSPKQTLISVAGACVLLPVLPTAGLSATLSWFLGLPFALRMILTLCWPAVVLMVLRQWRCDSKNFVSMIALRSKFFKALNFRLPNRVTRALRCDALHWYPAHSIEPGSLRHGGTVLHPFHITTFYLFLTSSSGLKWQEAPTIKHVLALATVALATASMLTIRGLHWRVLLAPGGMRRGQIGNAAFGATFLGLFSLLGIWCAMFLVAETVFPHSSLRSPIQSVSGGVLLTIELAFAVSVGVVIRSLPCGPHLRNAVWSAQLMALLAWLTCLFWRKPLPQGDAIGPLHLAILVALTWLNVHIANRLWTPQHLLRSVRNSI